MSYPIAQLDIAPDWKGLYLRAQLAPDVEAHLYAEEAFNVEFYGSVMKKRAGSVLANGLSDCLDTAMAQGATVMPQLRVTSWSTYKWLAPNMVIKAWIWDPNDPNTLEPYDFTITIVAGDTITVSPAAPVALPAGTTVKIFPYTQDRRIGGIFQPTFRNGTFPTLVATVHQSTGEFLLHLLGNRVAKPFDLYARIPQTTVSQAFAAGWGVTGGKLASVEGLQIGDWVYFPQATPGQQNGRILGVNPVDHTIALDFYTPVNPFPQVGWVCKFLPTTCPGRISASRPIGLGKISASHMGNRTLIAQPGYPPLRYAHTDSVLIESATSGSAMRISPPLASTFVGREVVISDIADPDGVGHVHLTRIASIAANAQDITVSPALPVTVSPGAILDVIAISRVGVRAPATPPTLTAGGTGSIYAGTYSVRVTFVSTEGGAYVESEACQPTTRVTATANQALTISAIPVPLDPRVTKKRIYRTSAGGDGVWYYTAEIDPNVTSYVDTKNDISLGAQLREFVNYPPYETMEVVAEWPHAQRLMGIAQVGAAAWAVVWTDGVDVARAQPRPESWPVDNFLFIGLDTGDRPRGIAAFYDSMLIFCERSIWRIQGNPPDLVVEPVNFQQHGQSGIGVGSHQAIVVDQNEVIFPGPDGVYLLNRFSGVATGFQSQRISRQIDRKFDEATTAARNRVHAVFLRNRRQYRLFRPEGTLRTSNAEPVEVLVHQFDADLDGDSYYWTRWMFTKGPVEGVAEVTCSSIIRPEPGDSYRFASYREACFVGTLDGAILGLDYVFDYDTNGFTDYTVTPFPMVYRTLPFGPAGGMGTPALGRFLHLMLRLGVPYTAIPLLTPAREVEAAIWARVQSQRQTSIYEEGEVIYDPGPQTPNARFALVPNPDLQELNDPVVGLRRLVLLARGQYHQIEISDLAGDRESGLRFQGGHDRQLELHRMAYFSQRLPEAAIPETDVQVEPVD